MDPTSTVTLIAALIGAIDRVGGWGVGGVLFMLFLIPCAIGFIGYKLIAGLFSSLDQRIVSSDLKTESLFRQMAAKYDNNVKLVEDVSKLVKNSQDLNDVLIEIVKENTRALSKLVERIGVVINRKD
ncbi:MAG: hypothetical protein WC340_16565 [Kiritimatiellia bacterium]